ncbi:MAG: hypothetical protein AAGF32_03055, partial [Pseudomonadota bacterium]
MSSDPKTRNEMISRLLLAIEARGADLARHDLETAAQIRAHGSEPSVAAALQEARALDTALTAVRHVDGVPGAQRPAPHADASAARLDALMTSVLDNIDAEKHAGRPTLHVINGGQGDAALRAQAPLEPQRRAASAARSGAASGAANRAAQRQYPAASRGAPSATRWAVAATLVGAFALGVLLGASGTQTGVTL